MAAKAMHLIDTTIEDRDGVPFESSDLLLLVFLDEFADFRSNLMAWYSEIKVRGDATKPIALSRVASIARKGRTSRVHPR